MPPRRILKPLALAAAALVAAVVACSNPGPPQAGGVSGTYDLARVGNYVFVTSADRSELRVIDARPDGGPGDAPPHDWVRAPNPLEVLQIPVVERPVGLARDLAYATAPVDETTPAGGEITGPYVYAFAAARPEISVVGADPSQLKELRRLSTNGPVTAVSAIGPSATGGNSLLLYATLADGGQLYSVSLAPPDQIANQNPSPQLLASYPVGETIVSLQALPLHQEVAVATRSLTPSPDGGAPLVGGRTEALALTGAARRPLNFGAPIRQLETHPGTADQEIPPEATLFGLVDEQSCGGTGGAACTGILAVDVATGQPRTDFSGLPALPVSFIRGLPQSMTFTANARVRSRVGGDDAGVRDVPVMGLATSTDGQLYFFEAVGRPGVAGGALPDGGFRAQWTVRHINQVSLPGSGSALLYVGFGADGGITTLPTPAQPQFAPDGGETTTPYYGPVLTSIVTGLGSAVAEPIKVAFEGPIPGLTSLPTQPADGQTFPLPPGAPEERAEIGDRVVLSLADGTPCGEVALTGRAPLSTSDTIPAACAGRALFTVRAAGARPYVVTGLVSGYMGRVGDATQSPGQPVMRETFTFQGTPYYRPDDDPLNTRPALRFEMGLREPSLRRDAYYQFNTSTGFDPLYFFLSTDATGWPGYHLPYGVVHLPNTPRVYVTYPSVGRTTLLGSGAVIELDPTFMAPNQANVQITSAYR